MHSSLMQCSALKLYRVKLCINPVYAFACLPRARPSFPDFYFLQRESSDMYGSQFRNHSSVAEDLIFNAVPALPSGESPSHVIMDLVRETAGLPGGYVAGGSGLRRPWGATRVFTVPTHLIGSKEEAALTWGWQIPKCGWINPQYAAAVPNPARAPQWDWALWSLWIA